MNNFVQQFPDQYYDDKPKVMNKYLRYIFNHFDFTRHGTSLTMTILFLTISLLLIILGGMFVTHALIINPNITPYDPIPKFDTERWDKYTEQINTFIFYLNIMCYIAISFFAIGMYQLLQRYRVRQIMKTIDRVN